MIVGTPDFWSDKASVLFTSLWGWSPETWGTIGWTGQQGLTRRANLLRQMTDPFIVVCYVTGNKNLADDELQGKIAGFYLVTHEMGHKHEFTDPIHHLEYPEKWQHSLRATRAFSYLPEHRLSVAELNPDFLKRARSIASMGKILTDARQINLLRETPWIEVDIYRSTAGNYGAEDENFSTQGYTRAGPASKNGYVVSAGTQQLGRQLYALRLSGNTDAYLGKPAAGRSIFKIGLSVSPEMRRLSFQKAMPRGTFNWHLYRPVKKGEPTIVSSFETAVAGEDAMKKYLSKCAEWLGGEFYLATEEEIETAWQLGCEAVQSFGKI